MTFFSLLNVISCINTQVSIAINNTIIKQNNNFLCGDETNFGSSNFPYIIQRLGTEEWV